jgi:two-component system, OmpR family, sensor kinase
MSLRIRILLLLVVIASAVVAMAVMVHLTIRGTDFYRQRVAFAHQQLAAIIELATAANRYSEQIAGTLLLGDQQIQAVTEARTEIERSFANLRRVTAAELVFLEGSPERGEEARELEQLESLHRLYAEIDRSVEQVFLYNGSGRRAEALSIFRAAIKSRLEGDLQRLLTEAVAGERAEVAAAEARAAALSRRLTIALIATAILGLSISIGAALLLSRSLSGSIGRLTAGAAAIGRGVLGHRVEVSGNDELAALSRRFNEMADQIEDQQRRLVQAKSGLESQIQERTAELQQANERLRHLDRSRVQFLADISHELRTPLTIIRGEAEVCLRGSARPAADYRDTLHRIVEQVAQMSRLVEDLLFLARSEADTVRFESRTVTLQDVLAEAVSAGESLTKPGGIRLERAWPDEPILIEADPQRLKQAVVILVDNAIKYSDNDEVVQVIAGRNGDFAEVSVIDHGPGIPADDLPYVFERFYRGGKARGDLGGSGLGLPIARWIAEKHGGVISVTSEPNVHTEFRIRLPLES